MLIFIELARAVAVFVAQGVQWNAGAKVALEGGVEVALAAGAGLALVALVSAVGQQVAPFGHGNALVVVALEFGIFLALPPDAAHLVAPVITVFHEIAVLLIKLVSLI